MKTFEEIWKFTDTIPGSFTTLSGQKLHEQLLLVPEDGWIVEVGVDQGRSASLMLNVAELNDIFVVLVDSWESILIDNLYKVKQLASLFPLAKVDIWNLPSDRAAQKFWGEIDLIHIDANHHAPHPEEDCTLWLPKVKSGGVACFHDCGQGSTFPAVQEAVDKHTAGWEDLGTWDSLAIRRKP